MGVQAFLSVIKDYINIPIIRATFAIKNKAFQSCLKCYILVIFHNEATSFFDLKRWTSLLSDQVSPIRTLVSDVKDYRALILLFYDVVATFVGFSLDDSIFFEEKGSSDLFQISLIIWVAYQHQNSLDFLSKRSLTTSNRRNRDCYSSFDLFFLLYFVVLGRSVWLFHKMFGARNPGLNICWLAPTMNNIYC